LLVGSGHFWSVRLLQFAAALVRMLLTLNRQWHSQAGMSDIGLTVPGMTKPPRRYDVTVTVNSDSGHRPIPAEFAVAAQQAASARAASIVTAHMASQIISVVTVYAADQPAAVAVALAVVSDALKRPVASSIR
jgi:hypothetical protein